MNLDNATPELFAALAGAQAEVENAVKGSVNPHFKSRYADLADVLNTVRPVFARHGLSLIQSTGFEDGNVHVETVIGHAGGGWVSSIAACVPPKPDAQGIGAATTYLRRYSLAAMCGIAQEDDDGNAASTKPAAQAPAAAPQYITANQHRALEAQIAELEIDRERVKSWVGRRWQIAEPHLNQLTDSQFHALLDMLPKFAAAQAPA